MSPFRIETGIIAHLDGDPSGLNVRGRGSLDVKDVDYTYDPDVNDTQQCSRLPLGSGEIIAFSSQGSSQRGKKGTTLVWFRPNRDIPVKQIIHSIGPDVDTITTVKVKEAIYAIRVTRHDQDLTK